MYYFKFTGVFDGILGECHNQMRDLVSMHMYILYMLGCFPLSGCQSVTRMTVTTFGFGDLEKTLPLLLEDGATVT